MIINSLDNLEEQVGEIRLDPGQLAFFMSTAKVSLAAAGIRGGKTHVGALKTIFYALDNPCDEDTVHLVCSPTYKMSKVPVQKIFKLLYDKEIFPVCPLVKFVRSERVFILATEGGFTKIQVVSLHDPDKIRGIKALSAWLDEGAYISEEAWEIVQGRLADVDGPAWITTTPAGHNWVYEQVYARARDEALEGVPIEEREMRVFHWRSTDNSYVPRENFLRLAKGFDPITFAQEVEAKFVSRRGAVYYTFKRAMHVRRGLRLDPTLPLWVGQDFNISPMATTISQPWTNAKGQKGMRVVGERAVDNSNTPELVTWMKALCVAARVPPSNVIFHPDASGAARSTSGASDFQIIRAAGFKVDAPKANPRIKDRVNCLNGLLLPSDTRTPRMEISDQCPRVIESLEKQVWDPDADPPVPDKSQGHDHMNDALGYSAWRRFPLRAQVTIGKATKRRAA